MDLDHWLIFFRELGSRLRGQALALSGRPEAGREVRIGAGGDTTTFIDEWAEGIILRGLSGIHAGGESFTLVSEELGWRPFGAGDTKLLVDPIDGSLNAKRGVPFFATSLALIEGEALSGTRLGFVINLANGDEFWAIRGKGAYRNGLPLQPCGSGTMEILAYEASNPRRDVQALLPILPYVTRSRCLGSTALDLCYTACGHIDLFFVPNSSRCFDFAAGRLILEEAGGVVTDLEGKNLGGLAIRLQERTSLVASYSLPIHEQALKILRED